MADAGVNQYTFHIEPVTNVAEVCRKIREHGMKVSCVRNLFCCLTGLTTNIPDIIHFELMYTCSTYLR